MLKEYTANGYVESIENGRRTRAFESQIIGICGLDLAIQTGR